MTRNCSKCSSLPPGASRRAVRTSASAAAAPCSTSIPPRSSPPRSASSRTTSSGWAASPRGAGLRRCLARSGATGAARASAPSTCARRAAWWSASASAAAPYVAELKGCEVLAAPAGALIGPLAQLLDCALDPRARAADRGRGRRQRHRAGVARAQASRRAGPRAAARLRRAHAVQVLPAARRARIGRAAGAGRCAAALPPGRVWPRARVSPPPISSRSTAPSMPPWWQRAVELLELDRGRLRCSIFSAASATSPCRWRAARAGGRRRGRGRADRARPRQRGANGIAQRAVSCRQPQRRAAPQAPWLRQAYDHVLLDPPRTGAREVLGTRRGPRAAAGAVYFLPSREAWRGTWGCWCTSTA